MLYDSATSPSEASLIVFISQILKSKCGTKGIHLFLVKLYKYINIYEQLKYLFFYFCTNTVN